MMYQMGRIALITSVVCIVSVAADHGYTDSAEYNLVRAIEVQPDPQRKLALIDRWQHLYPRSPQRQQRYELLVRTQQGLGMAKEMWNTALAMSADDPEGHGPYWVATLVVNLRDTSPAALQKAESAARMLLAQRSGGMETTAHRALGWVAMCRNRWKDAETEFRIVLIREPSDAEASFWLGTSILASGDSARQPSALYHLARSLVVTGAGELSPAQRDLVQKQFEDLYIRSHGSMKGMDTLYAKAREGALPAQ